FAFFFQAEDGIRDFHVTGVQTCALPIYEGDINHPTMTMEDRDYIIDAVNYMFPSLHITANDLESSWAGLRPLIAEDGKKPGEISRKDEIFISNSGLISMAGGKLTGYRKMAEQAVNTVTNQLKEELGIIYSNSETKHLPISGGDVGGSQGFEQFIKKKAKEGVMLGLEHEEAVKLIQKYGSNRSEERR